MDCRTKRFCNKDDYCEGWVGASPPCTDHISFDCDESMNRKGPGKCYSNMDCSLGRMCDAKGFCADKPKPIIALADPPK